jgi:hypothetical protein
LGLPTDGGVASWLPICPHSHAFLEGPPYYDEHFLLGHMLLLVLHTRQGQQTKYQACLHRQMPTGLKFFSGCHGLDPCAPKGPHGKGFVPGWCSCLGRWYNIWETGPWRIPLVHWRCTLKGDCGIPVYVSFLLCFLDHEVRSLLCHVFPAMMCCPRQKPKVHGVTWSWIGTSMTINEINLFCL